SCWIRYRLLRCASRRIVDFLPEGALDRLARARERDATPCATHEHRLCGTWAILLLGADAVPHTGVIKLPRGGRVGEQRIDRRCKFALGADVFDRCDNLNAMIEIARHEISTSHVEPAAIAGLEMKEPAVLEE